MNQSALKWPEAVNIICIRLDNMGDVLMTSPAIRAVKKAHKGRRITLLTSRKGYGISEFIQGIDETMVFNAPWVKQDRDSDFILPMVKKIKQKKFDGAIVFTNFSQNPLPAVMLAYLSEIPLRLSYSRENPYQLLTDWVVDKEPFEAVQHGVQRQLDLVAHVNIKTKDNRLSLTIPDKYFNSLILKLKKQKIDFKKPWIIMHPNASEIKRRYPPYLFAKTAKKLINETGYQILLSGIPSEADFTGKIAKLTGGGSFSLAGKLALGEFICLIDHAKLLISNNSGPVHIAAAVGTPVVVLYARTNLEHIPWKVKSEVLYFDISKRMQSKNTLLQFVTPKTSILLPSPDDISRAARNLLNC